MGGQELHALHRSSQLSQSISNKQQNGLIVKNFPNLCRGPKI